MLLHANHDLQKINNIIYKPENLKTYIRPIFASEGGGGDEPDGEAADMGDAVCDVAPLGDRALLFYSDFRAPHEVLPAQSERYAATLWYTDATERGTTV